MRRRIYIAGPISIGNLANNINQATDAFIHLSRAGFAPFCPHWSAFSGGCVSVAEHATVAIGTVHGNPHMDHADWLGVDLPWVQVAHAILRLPGESRGADREVEHARQCKIPVFFDIRVLIDSLRDS